MENLESRLRESSQVLGDRCGAFPEFVVVLGSGLSNLLEHMEVETVIDLAELPHMKPITVAGHKSRLTIGMLQGVRVACMQGRLHYYEGYTMQEVVYPFRVFGSAGAKVFVLTNASGALRPGLQPRDLVLIRDHVNLMGSNPLFGQNPDFLGPRFPDMTELYDPALRDLVKKAARELNIELHEGVYFGLHGPSYETPAEIALYQKLGCDVVGMSTVPEAIAIHHMAKKVVAISCVSNLAAGVSETPLKHSDVLDIAKQGHPGFAKLIAESINAIKTNILS